MENEKLIKMLNRDLADEHAAIIRYLIHSYLEGEDSPLGAGLLSRAREEMWHMHWLGMIIGKMGGEPDMTPAPYPYDPTNRKTIFQSYVAYEKKLIPHYMKEADLVDDPHIKRVLQREAWESEMHATKFQRTHDKLAPDKAESLPGEENELPEQFIASIQKIVEVKYTQMLQALRDAWVFQNNDLSGWKIIDFSFTKMKQLAHMAEEVAENGIVPRLNMGPLLTSSSIGIALQNALESVQASRKHHEQLKNDPETQKHSGLLTLQRYLRTIKLDINNNVCYTTIQPLKKGGRPCYQSFDATNTFTQYRNLILAKAISKTLQMNSVGFTNSLLIVFSVVNPEGTFLNTWQVSSAR